jgi:hypothetical protein
MMVGGLMCVTESSAYLHLQTRSIIYVATSCPVCWVWQQLLLTAAWMTACSAPLTLALSCASITVGSGCSSSRWRRHTAAVHPHGFDTVAEVVEAPLLQGWQQDRGMHMHVSLWGRSTWLWASGPWVLFERQLCSPLV